MAGSMKDIKLRIKSVESTMQITKAMELVASSKLRRAKQRVENSRPCFELMHSTLADIAENNTDLSSPFITARPVGRSCYVVIAGDRGLAGGYNSNIFKTAAAHMQDRPRCILPVGKKALEQFQRRGDEILSRDFALAEEVGVSECFAMAKLLAEGYLAGSFDEVLVVYTNFVSMLTQSPAVLRLLPITAPVRERGGAPKQLTLYEPNCEEVYNAIVPEYLAGLLYGALCESVASELGARRTAMDAASKNAGEMIEALSLNYNRARQAAITQEITEIVAGGEG